MKKSIVIIYLMILSAGVGLISCTSGDSAQKVEYGKATEELIQIVDNNPEIKSLLIASLKKAKSINPDKNTNPAQSLEEYYEFVSWAETSMPWNLLQSNDYPTMYDNIIQSLCYFYFLNDQPLPELEDRGYFNNSLQYVEPYSSWLTTFNKTWGTYLDTEASWKDEYYQMALKDKKFGLDQGWYEDPSEWKTFNEFFARYLKSPDQRPIASPEDHSVVASPADSEPQGVWQIDENSMIISDNGVPVKSMTLQSIEKLIGEESEYEQEFANGTFTHSFLNVNDYHRYHFPLGGIIREVRIIDEIEAVGAIVFWDEENKRYAFDPSRIGWQSVETRGCVILETERYGLVAILPIGMAQVNSVNFEKSVQPGKEVKKGDMLGYFLFGGSDFIMVFQEEAGFKLTAPKTEDAKYYQHVLMGEEYGRLGGGDLSFK